METHIVEVLGLIMSLLLAAAGALLNRSIKQVDTAIQVLTVSQQRVSDALVHLQSELKSDGQMREFQDRRIEALEREKRILYNAFNKIDRILFQKLGQSIPLSEE